MSDQRVDDRIYDAPPVVPQPPTTLPNEPYYQQPSAGNRNARKMLGVALVLIGLLWLFFGGFRLHGVPGISIGSTTIVDKAFAAKRLEMHVGSGDVEIHPSDTNDIQVTAIRQGGAWDTYTVDVQQSGDMVRVTQAEKDFTSFFGQNKIRYEIKIPAGLETNIQTSSGEITTDGNSGAVTLTTVDGDVEARNVTKGISIATTSGDVALRDAAGALTVKTVSGDIQLNNVADALHLQSDSGDIDVRNGHDVQLTASTTSGDIQYNGNLAHAENNTITTDNGDVELRLPNNDDLHIQATTTSGDIDSEFALNANNGATGLSVETNSGDIDIK